MKIINKTPLLVKTPFEMYNLCMLTLGQEYIEKQVYYTNQKIKEYNKTFIESNIIVEPEAVFFISELIYNINLSKDELSKLNSILDTLHINILDKITEQTNIEIMPEEFLNNPTKLKELDEIYLNSSFDY